MNVRARVLVPLAIAALCACENPGAPVPDEGRVVLRFAPAPADAGGAAMSTGAAFDSVAVRVFRAGAALTLEAARGAALAVDAPVEISVSCIAEPGKRVSVELFNAGAMVHHGAAADVDVAAGRSTAVRIEVLPFRVDVLSVEPVLAGGDEPLALRWNRAPAAQRYRVEESARPDFAVIGWQREVDDTTLSVDAAPGSHYFRVTPLTAYANGTAGPAAFGYVLGGSNSLAVTGFSAPAVIPGETVTILGENLDFPGTGVWMNGVELAVESWSWDALVVRVPAGAVSGSVTVSGTLGIDESPDPLWVQRIAYVTTVGAQAASWAALLSKFADHVGSAAMAVIPAAQLDWRDMDVFDIILVADDTGGDPSTWGGNAARAAAIASSDTPVLAVGEGGASFLRAVAGATAGTGVVVSFQTSWYTESPSSGVFTTPHTVLSGTSPQWIDVGQDAARTVALVGGNGRPAGLIVEAESGIATDRWVLAQLRLGASSKPAVFWGHAADPSTLTSGGQDCVANLLHLLYQAR